MNENWVWPAIALAAMIGAVLGFRDAGAETAEIVYSQAWCKAAGGKHQFRVVHPVTGELVGWADCATKTEVVEVEKERKWYEGVGQVLMYAQYTGLRPRLVLVGKPYGRYHLRALNLVYLYRLPIEVEVIEP